MNGVSRPWLRLSWVVLGLGLWSSSMARAQQQAPPSSPSPPSAGSPADPREQACNAKDGKACLALVKQYETVDLYKAIQWARRACSANEVEGGCAFAGLKTFMAGDRKRAREAQPYLERACYEEHALKQTACETLADAYQLTDPQDAIDRKRVLAHACAHGGAAACKRNEQIPFPPGATDWRDLGSPFGTNALVEDALALSDREVLVIVQANLYEGGRPEALWRTTDAGRSWKVVHEAVNAKTSYVSGASFGRRLAADGRVVLYRARDEWVRSADGGATFTALPALQSKGPDAAHMVARVRHDFFVGEGKRLLVSTDGGKTFALHLETPTTITSVQALDDVLFVKLAGDGGKGYRVDNGRLVEAETFPFTDGKVAARSYFKSGLETSTDQGRTWQSWHVGFAVIEGFAVTARAMFVSTGKAALWSSFGGTPRDLARPPDTKFCRGLWVLGPTLVQGCFTGSGKTTALHLFAIDYEKVGGKPIAAAALPPAYAPPPAPTAASAPAPGPAAAPASTFVAPGATSYSKSWRAGDPTFSPWRNPQSAMFYNQQGYLQFESYYDTPNWTYLVDNGPVIAGRDFTIAVDVRQLANRGKWEAFGIMWGVAPTSFASQQVFWLDSQGRYAFSYNAGGPQITPIPWTASASLPRGAATYHVEIKRAGTRYSFWVNGRLIATYRSPAIVGSRLGFLVGGRGVLEVQNVQVRPSERLSFDEVMAELPPAATTAAPAPAPSLPSARPRPAAPPTTPPPPELTEAEVVANLQRGCDAGSCASCARLAEHPSASLAQQQEARTRGRAACDTECRAAGDKLIVDNGQDACLHLGTFLVRANPTGNSKELAPALSALEASCAKNGFGCEELGLVYTYADLTPKDEPRLAALLKQRCGELSDWGHQTLGQSPTFCYNGELRAGRRDRLQKCKRGTLTACTELGKDLLSYVPALALWSLGKACDAGDLVACFHLARVYDDGLKGVRRDPERVKALLAKVEPACDKGDPEICALFAERESSSVKPADNRWLIKALVFETQRCAAGNGKACQRAAFAHRLGRGTPRDEAKAKELLQKACAAGVSEACK